MRPSKAWQAGAALLATLVITVVGTAAAQTTITVTPGAEVRVAKPEGYMGITFSGDQRIEPGPNSVLVSYERRPVIVSVEPGSPAERAGLVAGDTILAFSGHDVTGEPFPLYDMLRPGARIHVRIKRGGNVRTIPVRVGRRPASSSASAYAYRFPVIPSMDQRFQDEVRREVERAQAEAEREIDRAERELERERSRIRATTRPPVPRTPVPPMTFSGTLAGVAGAEMAPLNEDLASLVNVRRGVFVVNVNPGTPAERSGLRGGDVIVAVRDSAVADLAQLRRAINREQRRARSDGSDREVPLRIVRKGRRQAVTLRW